MIIDTQKSTIRIQLQKLAYLLLLVTFLVLLFTLPFFKKPFVGLERNQLAIIATLLFVLYYSFSFFRDFNYFYFNNSSSKIIIRYYSLKPLTNDQNSVELNKQDFHKYEIKSSYGGLRKYLIIYQRTAKGIAKYPPISISILKQNDVDQLARELSSGK